LLVTIIVVWLIASIVIGLFLSREPGPGYRPRKPAPPIEASTWRVIGIVFGVEMLLALIGSLVPH
jgi:hypothetical protein